MKPDPCLVLVLSVSWSVLVAGLGQPVLQNVDQLTEEQRKVVDFALVQLQGGEGCDQRLINVENFSQQVVAGLRYKFDIVMKTKCGEVEEEKKCSMDVYSRPWEQMMTVQWENVKCGGDDDEDEVVKEEMTTKPSRIHLSVPLLKDILGARVGVVDLLGEDDHDDVPHGKPLLGGGDHDLVPHGKPLLGSDKVHHGPLFNDEYTVKELKSQKESWEELKDLQSLSSFHDFMAAHSKNYSSRKEYKHRYGVFKENMKKVQFLRESEQGTAEYGPTFFSDLTEMEFKQYTGMPLWKRKRSGISDDDPVVWPPAEIPDVALPKEFDWREAGAVTEVKNQGQCGSCWAFSVTGNVEGGYFVKHGKLLDLSEQELVDCDKRDNGCNGGLPENAYKTLMEIGGLETEEDYGYDGEDEACKFNRTRVAARVSGGVEIGKNETQMAQWLLKNGPISVGLNANAMQFYKGGVSHPFKFLCDPSGIDHGVLIVGFGEHEYPLFKKKMPYWIIKNSWGTGWGESGYYRLYRGDGTCGINLLTSSAIVQ